MLFGNNNCIKHQQKQITAVKLNNGQQHKLRSFPEQTSEAGLKCPSNNSEADSPSDLSTVLVMAA